MLKKIISICICVIQTLLLTGQTPADSLNLQNYEIIRVSGLNTNLNSLSLFKANTKAANIYYGLANKNSIDFCAVNDSCMLIHDVENKNFILIGPNNQVLDQFYYFKRIHGLKKVMPGSPFCGANGNISYINDSTIFISTIKKRSHFCLFYIFIKNNKIIPVIEKLDKYPDFFDEKMAKSPVWKIFNVFKSKEVIIVSYCNVQSFSDSLIINPQLINDNYRVGVYGKNYFTKDTMNIVNEKNSRFPSTVYDFNNSFLIVEESYGKIYQYDYNLKCIDTVKGIPDLGKSLRIIKIYKDAKTDITYVTLMTYNKQHKKYCFDIYKIVNTLELKFYKHLSFERETYIKAINNNKLFFPYVNNDDFKYYIYTIDLNAIQKDSLYIAYGSKKPPKLKVNIFDSQINLMRMGKDKSTDLSKDDFVMLKKRDRKLFPEIEKNELKYPQSTVKEVIQSVIKATDNNDFFYNELYLSICEKNDYEFGYIDSRETLKKEIANKTCFLEENNYKFIEIRRLLIKLLENIDFAYLGSAEKHPHC